MLDNLQSALAYTELPFAHFAWAKTANVNSTDHGVWAEDNDIVLYANDGHSETITQGTIDYYTRTDDGAAKATIEAALESYNVMFRLESVQYEEDTGFIHYEWVFEELA